MKDHAKTDPAGAVRSCGEILDIVGRQKREDQWIAPAIWSTLSEIESPAATHALVERYRKTGSPADRSSILQALARKHHKTEESLAILRKVSSDDSNRLHQALAQQALEKMGEQPPGKRIRMEDLAREAMERDIPQPPQGRE